MPSKDASPTQYVIDPCCMETATNPHAWQLSDLVRIPKAIGSATGQQVRVASTFSGGGGSSMGYKRAGCRVTAANDIDERQAWHYRINLAERPGQQRTTLYVTPIRELIAAPPAEYQQLDILDGSPPCSTFSMLGNREQDWGINKKFREGQVEQVLSDLFFDFLDLVAATRPRTVIAENVKGMLVGNAKGYVRAIDARLRAIGYRPQIFLLNAARCGVPQVRERVFITAIRGDLTGEPLQLLPTGRAIGCYEATADLHITDDERAYYQPRAGDKRWWHRCRWGEPYDKMKKRLGILPATNFNAMRAHPYQPIKTLSTSSHMFMHWSEQRPFTGRELVRLGSFPDDYVFQDRRDVPYIIGMSVPPKLTEFVARAVCTQWLGVQYPLAP